MLADPDIDWELSRSSDDPYWLRELCAEVPLSDNLRLIRMRQGRQLLAYVLLISIFVAVAALIALG
jgi:hypothetical protein